MPVFGREQRPEIAESWRRSRIAGLTPETGLDRLAIAPFELASPLLIAAAPVLDTVARDMAGLNYSLLLGDAECRIVARWCDRRSIDAELESAGAVTGSRWMESDVGTNGLGTPIEVRNGIWVRGAEHYASALSRFACYGLPILHPITRRVEGVLNITVRPEDAHPLFVTTLARAANDIEQGLIDMSKPSDTQLYRAFREANRTGRAIVALNDDIMLANNAALAIVEGLDLEVLREMAYSPVHSGRVMTDSISLVSGLTVSVVVARLHDASHGTVFRLTVKSGPTNALNRDLMTPPLTITNKNATGTGVRSVYVGGEAGSGRTTVARNLLEGNTITVMEALDCHEQGPMKWMSALSSATNGETNSVIIEHIECLPKELVGLLSRMLNQDSHKTQIVLTGPPLTWLPPQIRALSTRCSQNIALAPLCERRSEIPSLAQSVLNRIAPEGIRPLTPAVIKVLVAQPWPGNLTELTKVLAHALKMRPFGSLEVADLPAEYQIPPQPALAGRAQAERDAIIKALRQFEGNKSRTAKYLGITRTTLYNRLRTLKITDNSINFSHNRHW